MRRTLLVCGVIVGFLTLAFVSVQAQGTSVIVRVNVPVVNQNQPLPVSVDFSPSGGVERVVLNYRYFGESEFKQLDMLLAGNSATTTLAAEFVNPPYIEYYIQAELSGGRTETYPPENPQVNPMKATVKPIDPKNLEVRMLSPEQGETVSAEDLVIAVSLFYASDNVDGKATKLFLNGIDVTSMAVFSDDVILFSPANFSRPLSLGVQFVRVQLYDKKGAPYHTIESNFNLSTASAIEAAETRLRMGVDGQAEYRREDIGTTVSTFTRGQLRFNGNYRSLAFGANMQLTNEEKADRQPQNRLLAYADLDFLKVQYGDAYPKFPSYIVSGKRVRGISANLFLKFFNVDVSYGQITRNIDGSPLQNYTGKTDSLLNYLVGGKVDSSALNTRPENSLQTTLGNYVVFNSGTFSRNFLAIRPSFGSGENFQLGFTYMKAKDDVGSIRYGIRPQENFVGGADMMIAFDDQKFRIDAQASLSLVNNNIARGNFSDYDYDLLAGKFDPDLTATERADRQKQSDDIRNIANLASKIITINEYLTPLNPVGTGLPALAYEGTLTMNYFNNFIRAQYYQRGATYTSFGNEFLQADIQGLAVSDRIRLLSNRVLLSVSYEQRKDNTAQTKVYTTTYDYLNSSLTLYPANNWPSFTLGYGINNRKNDAKKDLTRPNNPELNLADDATSRMSAQINYDFVAGARHNLSMGANIANKKDNTLNKRDQTNNMYFGSLTSVFSFPLQTTLTFSTGQTKSQQLLIPDNAQSQLLETLLKISSLSANVQYRLINDKLRLVASYNSTFGDLKRTLLQGGLDYSITESHAVMFQYDYILNSGTNILTGEKFKNDNIMSLIYRFNF
jgi:hypothetical protein